MTRFWDLWTLRFASWMIYMLGLLFAWGLCCTCFISGLLSNYGFNYLPRISGYFLKAQLECVCQPGIFQPVRLKKELLLFWILGLLLAMQHGFTSHQCTCFGRWSSWGYCLWHGFTAFDMGLLPLTWGYYFWHEAISCQTVDKNMFVLMLFVYIFPFFLCKN